MKVVMSPMNILQSRKGQKKNQKNKSVPTVDSGNEDDDSSFKIKTVAQKKAEKKEREKKKRDEEKAKLRKMKEKEELEKGKKEQSKQREPQKRPEEEVLTLRGTPDTGAASEEKGDTAAALEGWSWPQKALVHVWSKLWSYYLVTSPHTHVCVCGGGVHLFVCRGGWRSIPLSLSMICF